MLFPLLLSASRHILDHEYWVCLHSLTGWVSLCSLKMKNAQFAPLQLTLSVTTMLGVEAMGIGYTDMIPSVMQYSQQRRRLPLRHGGSLPISHPRLPISTSRCLSPQLGQRKALLPLMSLWQPSSDSPSVELPMLLVMPFLQKIAKSLSWSLIQGCGSVFRSPHLWIFGGFNTERPRPQNSLLHLADGLLGLRVALIPSSQSWPADVYLPNWDRRRPAALDVSVISTLQRLTLCGAANVIGYALSAEDGKRASHEASCRDAGVSFRVLLIFESLGGLSDLGRKTLYSIGRLLGLRMGVPISDSVRHLFQRCSVCLWWGNATLWLHCFSCPPPQTDSIL